MVAYAKVGSALRRAAGLGGLALLVAACGSSAKHGGGDDSAAGQAGEPGSGGTSPSGGSGGGANGGKGGGSSGASARGGSGGDTSSGGTGGGGAGSGGAGGSGATAAGGRAGTGGGGSGGVPNIEPPPTTDFLPLRQASFDKLDLLFMIDNSPSMQGKQSLLAEAVPTLLRRLMTPDCVDENGEKTGAVADANSGLCPSGSPAFRPVQDLHVGIITSSLGDHGSKDVCSDAQSTASGGTYFYNDLAQLLPSVRPGANLYSWNDSSFLVWDPRDQSQVSDPHTPVTENETDQTKFTDNFSAQLTAPGDAGCGYEASLEAWYRFLVDPDPVASVGNDQQTSVRGPTNDVLLAQRQMFLRDDSVLGIVMLSDENDCSIIDEDGSQGWLVGFKGGVSAVTWHMPYATSVCATNPNDPCCRPCASAPAPGCPGNASDAVCSTMTNRTTTDDPMNLRCFQQKQRFGIDLLYPTSRYVEALTSASIRPRLTNSVPNPLFQGKRSKSEVVFLEIVGVPWQDISTEDSWSGRGLTYMTPEELADEDRWSVILGDVNANVMPTDTLMVESIDPRTTPPLPQTHPLIADATIAPATATSNTNPINGHEQDVTGSRDDLQFACIFPLENPISPADCTADPVGCDCNSDEFSRHSPLCTGVTASADGTQVNGKAYPGLRELEVMKGVGSSGVLASICAKNTTHVRSAAVDDAFGYDPAMSAFVDRIGPKFNPICLPLPLAVSGSDPTHLACHVAEIEADIASGDACDCASRGLSNANPAVTQRAYDDLRQRGFCGDAVQVSCQNYCVCEVPELGGDALTSCQNEPNYAGTDAGFCYVDPAQGAGSALLVQGCPGGRQRYVRFSGGLPSTGSTPFVDCAAADQ